MNDYRTRIQVNTAPLIRAKLDTLQAEHPADPTKILESPAVDPSQPARNGLLHKLLDMIAERI